MPTAPTFGGDVVKKKPAGLIQRVFLFLWLIAKLSDQPNALLGLFRCSLGFVSHGANNRASSTTVQRTADTIDSVRC